VVYKARPFTIGLGGWSSLSILLECLGIYKEAAMMAHEGQLILE
jgi:hypothetical protein